MPPTTDINRTRYVDVLIVGGGSAGFTAAEAAAGAGLQATILEKETEAFAGGNSYYTAGATRFVHDGIEDLQNFIEHDDRHSVTEVPPYSAEDYLADLKKVTEGRNDPELSQVLVEESGTTVRWLSNLGLKYRLMYERQAYQLNDGSYLFWGGLHVGNVGGGEGLMADHRKVAANLGIETCFGVTVVDLIVKDKQIRGVVAESSKGTEHIHAGAVVLAAGGFEANAQLREKYLGAGWAQAKVRGTPGNNGELLSIALSYGAGEGGDWSTAHSVQWDAFAAKNESNRELTNRLTRQSYPLGILVNQEGERFVDEGADFRNYTYAKYGRFVLEQPGSVAWQIFDSQTRPMLRTEEYDMPGISVTTADSIAELARVSGISEVGLQRTVSKFNTSIDTSRRFDPNVRDGRGAEVSPPKSNWALALDQGPFYAYPVTCGITFTFGGLRGDIDGRALDVQGRPIHGLFVCGEMLGGLFAGNYPGGSGLTAGMVFGRRAGLAAAAYAASANAGK